MNSVAFLAMLTSFAVVMGWYVWSYERGTDGRDGVLGLRTGGDEDEPPRERRRDEAPRDVRMGRPGAATTLQRVRERAAAANRDRRPPPTAKGPGARRRSPSRSGPNWPLD